MTYCESRFPEKYGTILAFMHVDDEDMEKLLIRMAKACLVVFPDVDIDAWLETWEKNIQSCNINTETIKLT